MKCVIKGPFNFVTRKGPFYINFELAHKEQKDESTLEITRNEVHVISGLTITGILYANNGLEFKMDVFVSGVKITNSPYSPVFDDNGRYIFNYSYEV